MKSIRVRPVEHSDKLAWLKMRAALWPTGERLHEDEVGRFFRGELKEPAFVVLAELDGQPKGFAEFSIRAFAEGCVTDRVGYLEGVYVETDARGRGAGRALVAAGESWAMSRGCEEFASDAELENELSAAVHRRLGFEEVGSIRCFRKLLA